MKSFCLKKGDDSLNTTMWVENENDMARISLETHRAYQGQWCSTIKLTVNEVKALQEHLSALLSEISM